MYKYIKGEVTISLENCIVLENNGIGFEIFVSDVNQYVVGDEYKIFVYNHIREEINQLFGFKTLEELNFYLQIISVKGVGPKIGLNVMSANIDEVGEAIATGNVKYLTSFSGIGPKAAKQIILDLSNKLEFSSEKPARISVDDIEYNNAVETLLSIGVTRKEIKKLDSELKKLKTESEMVKYVLANR